MRRNILRRNKVSNITNLDIRKISNIFITKLTNWLMLFANKKNPPYGLFYLFFISNAADWLKPFTKKILCVVCFIDFLIQRSCELSINCTTNNETRKNIYIK